MLKQTKPEKSYFPKSNIFLLMLMLGAVFSSAALKADIVVKVSRKTITNTSLNETNLNWDSFYRFVAITVKYPDKARKKGRFGQKPN